MESTNFFDMRTVIENSSHEKKENEEVIYNEGKTKKDMKRKQEREIEQHNSVGKY